MRFLQIVSARVAVSTNRTLTLIFHFTPQKTVEMMLMREQIKANLLMPEQNESDFRFHVLKLILGFSQIPILTFQTQSELPSIR